MKLIVLALAACYAAFGQTAAVAPPSFLSTATNPNTLVMASMVASQMADAKTDWHYTIAGKSYTLTPMQRLGMAGGIFGVAIAIEQAIPKTRKAVQIAGVVISGYFAGRALANTYVHGTSPADPPAATAAPKIAFAIRIH